jgi:ferredoxin
MNSESTHLDGRVNVTAQRKDGTILKVFTMRRGANLWVFLRNQGIPIGASCSGVGVCGACDVTLLQGNFLTETSAFEKNTLERNGKSSQCRLACLCRVGSDIIVTSDCW